MRNRVYIKSIHKWILTTYKKAQGLNMVSGVFGATFTEDFSSLQKGDSELFLSWLNFYHIFLMPGVVASALQVLRSSVMFWEGYLARRCFNVFYSFPVF